MKKLGPGYNEEGWTQQVVCVGRGRGFDAQLGCGAPLEVTKADLYTVHEHDIGGPRDEVRFVCPCGVENDMPHGHFFTDLPNKEDWLKKQAATLK